MNHSWMNDPRLKDMSPEKLRLLTAYAKELQSAPDDQKMNVFLSINKSASEKNINFSSQERELLIAALTDGMTQEEKNKVRIIQNLMSKFSRSGKV